MERNLGQISIGMDGVYFKKKKMHAEKNVGGKLWLDPGEQSKLTQMLRMCRE